MTTQRVERIPVVTLGWRLKLALGDDSVKGMADYLDVSRATISRWMADKGAPPKRGYLRLWAMRQGVPLEWLETGEAPADGPTGTTAPVADMNRYRQTRTAA